MKNKILFVCYGNAFRSQMAEGFFNQHNKNKNFVGVSAGTHPWEGIPEQTIQLMSEKRIDISRKASKRLTKEMIDDAYKIYILFDDDFSDLPQAKIVMMPIEDPMGQSMTDMRRIRDEIEDKVKKIIRELKLAITKE